MVNTLQGIYQSAAGVQSSTGVDPAIIAAMARTEGPTGANAGLISAGIQVAATTGRGASGASLGAGSSQIGQPSRFWAYQNGAEMSEAFSNYIKQQFPQAAPYLGNAAAFFQAMEGTNYNVVYNNPSVGPASGIDWNAIKAYWQQKISDAASFVTQWGSGGTTGTGPPSQVDPNAALSSGEQLVASSGAQAVATAGAEPHVITLIPGLTLPGGGGWAGVKIHTGLLWSVGFFVLAGILVAVGIYLAFQRQINQTVTTVGRAATRAA